LVRTAVAKIVHPVTPTRDTAPTARTPYKRHRPQLSEEERQARRAAADEKPSAEAAQVVGGHLEDRSLQGEPHEEPHNQDDPVETKGRWRGLQVIAAMVLVAVVLLIVFAANQMSSSESASTPPAQAATAAPTPSVDDPSPTMATPEDAQGDPCRFAPVDKLTQALGDGLGGGDLTVATENGASYVDEKTLVCSLVLPDTQTLGTNYYNGSLEIRRYRYDDASAGASSSIEGAECELGGASAEEVYSQTYDCSVKIHAVYNPDEDATPTRTPAGDGGVTTDGWNIGYVAPPGEYWYQITLAGIDGDPSQVVALEAVGRVLLNL
jgi:hypothetical protein